MCSLSAQSKQITKN